MSIEDWPANLYPQQMELVLRDSGTQFRSPFSGTTQSVNFVGEYWIANLTLPPRRSDKGATDPAPKLNAWLHWLKGGVNQARLYDFKYQYPRGTMRDTPTLQTTVNRGGTTIAITTSTAVETMLAGDKFSVGGQLFEVKTDAIGAGSLLTVTTVNRVRATIAATAAITWLRPTVAVVMPEQSGGLVFTPGAIQPASLQLEEAL